MTYAYKWKTLNGTIMTLSPRWAELHESSHEVRIISWEDHGEDH